MTSSETRSTVPGQHRWRRAIGVLSALGALALGVTALTACSSGSSGKSSESAAAAGSSGASSTAAPFTLHVGLVTKVGVDGVFGWADNQGLLVKDLASVGVTKVVFSTFASGPPLNAALEAGSVDVAEMGDTPALELRGTGFASRNIAISGINAQYYLLGKKGGATTLAGLAGKKVTAPTGTAPQQYLTQLLAEKGLTSQITISNVQTNDAVTAIQSGQIDAFVDSGPNAFQLQQEGYPVIAQTSDTPDLYTTSENIVAQKFLDDHPGFDKAWAQALADAVKSVNANPTAYWAFAAGAEKVSVSIATAANPLNSYPATAFSADGVTQLQSSYDFLNKNGNIKTPFDLKSWLAGST